VVRSERAEPEPWLEKSSDGAKGFLHPVNKIKIIKKYFDNLLIKSPF